MPIGVIINSLSVLLGGSIGALLGKRVPLKLRKTLPLIFGVASMSMGIGPIIKMNSLPAVVLALILGSAVGELIGLENLIEKTIIKVKNPVEKLFVVKEKSNSSPESGITPTSSQGEFMEKFVSIVVLFCASGTGVFGALTEGMTGDYTILLAKSILDFFAASIFATTLGYLVATIAISQFIVLILLFISSKFIMPLTTPAMLADFTALGGIIMLATGFRISGIKAFPIANMLPGFILVMPLSYFWTRLIV
ncbi:DUF554 domain-containing protein [Tissierella creatinini]|nr:DUF554 domain-containing protein [Tissierella creatinini]TJX67301.1 DUF554 domain-containing protein [Soehngenia saccharolytica]